MKKRFVSFLLVLFPILISSPVSVGARQDQARTAVYLTVKDVPVCVAESDMLQILQFIKQKDYEAVGRMVSINNRCDLLKPDITVYLMEKDEDNSLIRIRPKGQTASLWTVPQAIKEKTSQNTKLTPEAEKAGKIAEKITADVNTIFNSAQTTCIPAQNEDGASLDFVLFTSDDIFSTPARKKLWMVACAGAVGSVLNDTPNLRLGKMGMSDSKMIATGKVLTIQIDSVKRLQKKVKLGEITIDEMYSSLISEGKYQITGNTRR